MNHHGLKTKNDSAQSEIHTTAILHILFTDFSIIEEII